MLCEYHTASQLVTMPGNSNALQLLVGLVRWACEVAVEVMSQYNRFMLLVTHQ